MAEFKSALLGALLLGSVHAARVAIVFGSDCSNTNDGFNTQACLAQEQAAARFPNDEILGVVLPPVPNCEAWGAANASSMKLIIMVGFTYDACATAIARDHPNTWVGLIDSCPDAANSLPNFVCGVYLEDQPAYVAGYLAGLVSVTKVTGAVGGTPVPPVQKLFNGFIRGVGASCPECRVEGMYVNSFFHDANGAATGEYLVRNLSADVVFGCGGPTGSRAILTAASLGSMVIGVDSDEYPTTFANRPQAEKELLITSAVKRVDVAVGTMVALLLPLNTNDEIPGLVGTSLIFDYANSAVGVADCHQACARIGQVNLLKMRKKENDLASRVAEVGLVGSGYDIPLTPANAQPNVFYTAPNPAGPPAPRIQAAMTKFNAWLVDWVVIFGGKGSAGETYDDLWLYGVQSGKWLHGDHGITVGTPPPGLSKSCAVSMDLTTAIFGGRTAAGAQSGTVFTYTYQPTFLGFSDGASPLIRQTWATLTSVGDVPLAVEGPSCTAVGGSCTLVYGGRAQLQYSSTVHRLCLNASHAQWSVVSPTGTAPTAREGAGTALVNLTLLGISHPPGQSQALVVAAGVASQIARKDVWLLLDPLGGSPSWMRLPADLPLGVEASVVFAANAPTGTTSGAPQVLAVQPTSALPVSGFNTFTYDPNKETWNSQATSFDIEERRETRLASMVPGDTMWLFGGTTGGNFLNNLSISQFQVQTICAPGEQSQGAGCEPCSAGNFSAGGVGATCQPCSSGRFTNTSRAGQCADCPAGRWGGVTGQSQCPECPRGTFKGSGSQPCQLCPFGSFSNSTGAESDRTCEQCVAGKYTGSRGSSDQSDCRDCEPGRALSAAFGKAQCEACGPGHYSTAGLPECLRCLKGAYQPQAGKDFCMECASILLGSTTDTLGAIRAEECVCGSGFYREGNSSTSCSECPAGMSCSLGSDLRNYQQWKEQGLQVGLGPFPMLNERYWSHPDDPLNVFLCQNKHVCPGTFPGKCANAQTKGRSCAVCEDRHYKTPSGCKQCSHFESLIILFPIIPLILCPAVVCVMYYLFRDMPEKWGSWQNTLSSLSFILLNHYQMISLLQTVNVEMPDNVENIFKIWAISEDVISLFSVECAGFADFTLSFSVRSLVPILLLAECALTYVGTHIFARLTGHPVAMDADRLINVFLSVVYAFFTGVASLSLALFKCQLNPNGKSTLLKDRSIICFEEEWTSALGIAITAVIVYCVGCFILFGYQIAYAPVKFGDPVFQKRWKFLFIKYRPDVHWWSMVVLGKGVLLNIGTVFFTSAAVQLYWIYITQILYVSLVVTVSPWRRRIATLMDIFAHLAAMTAVSMVSWFAEDSAGVQSGMATCVVLTTMSPFMFCGAAAGFVALPAIPSHRVLQQKRELEAVCLLRDICADLSIMMDDDLHLLFRAIGSHDQHMLLGALKAIRAEMSAGERGGVRLVTRSVSAKLSQRLSEAVRGPSVRKQPEGSEECWRVSL